MCAYSHGCAKTHTVMSVRTHTHIHTHTHHGVCPPHTQFSSCPVNGIFYCPNCPVPLASLCYFTACLSGGCRFGTWAHLSSEIYVRAAAAISDSPNTWDSTVNMFIENLHFTRMIPRDAHITRHMEQNISSPDRS